MITLEKENKSIVRRLVDELHNCGNIELADEFFKPIALRHGRLPASIMSLAAR